MLARGVLDSAVVIIALGVLALFAQVPAPVPVALPFGIELPDGPAARAARACNRLVMTSDLPFADKEHSDVLDDSRIWERESTWQLWAKSIAEQSRAEKSNPSQRAWLALAAASQGRSDDAWEHLAALESAPEWLAAMLPHMFFGRWQDGNIGGIPGAANWTLGVGDGALLSPMLPPPSVPAREVMLGTGRIERRAMKISGLHVGAAIVDLRVALEYEGLQIDVEHKGGERATLRLRLPQPLDFELSTVYVDWERRESIAEPIELVLEPGHEPRIVFARFKPLYVSWSLAVPEALDTRAKLHGFALAVRDGDPERARIAGFAGAMSRLLGVPAEAVTPEAALKHLGIVLDLTASADRERKLVSLISQCERFALRRKP